MPDAPTAEQLELRRKGRQRLIGAVAIALAAVVFVPMLLDPEPRRPREEPELAIPSKDSAPPATLATRGPAPAAPAPAEAAKSAPPSAPAESRKSVEPKADEFKPPAPRPAAPPPAPKAPTTPQLEGFAVQVGAFRDEAKLAQAREKIVAARLAHYTERLDGSGGELTRLRAGPFPTREAAEKAAVLLKRGGLDTRVVTLP